MLKLRRLVGLLSMLSTLMIMPGAWSSTFEEARAAADAGNFSMATEILTPMAQSGEVRASALLGFLMLSGKGIAKNPQEAERLLNYSADHGNAGAMATLALSFWSGDLLTANPNIARQRAEQATAQDNPLGQFVLGSMKIASGTAQAQAEGVELLQKSAQKNIPMAQYQLGKLTTLGWLTARDRSLGLEMMHKAAQTMPRWKNSRTMFWRLSLTTRRSGGEATHCGVMAFSVQRAGVQTGAMRASCIAPPCGRSWPAS